MTKTIVSRTVEFLGNQVCVFFAGLVTGYICHALFDMSAKDAADITLTAQVFIAGFTIRGWL